MEVPEPEALIVKPGQRFTSSYSGFTLLYMGHERASAPLSLLPHASTGLSGS